MSDGAVFLFIVIVLALLLTAAMLVWYQRMEREAYEADLRERARKMHAVVDDERLSKMWVIEPDPGQVTDVRQR